MNTLRGPKRKSVGGVSVFIASGLCALTVFFFVMLRGAAHHAESALLSASSERIASQIAARLETMLTLGGELEILLLSDAGKDYAGIRTIAEEHIATIPFIDSITVAPGAIVRYTFPEERGSTSIGHDLLDNPERMKALIEAVRKKKAVLQGPSVSAEGKHLAFLRIPVLNKTELWGFVSIGFDADRLISELDLPRGFPGLSIAVASSGPEDRSRQVFWGDQRALRGYAAEVRREKDGAEVFPWAVYTASSFPAVQVVWWGLGLLALNVVSLGLFLLDRVLRRPRSPQRAQGRGGVGGQGPRMAPPEESSHLNASFVVKPFVPEPAKVAPSSSDGPNPCPGGAVDEEPCAPASSTVPSAVPKPLSESPAPPVSVLVVDDSEVNRELLLRMLALKGYEAAAVPSGQLALDILRQRKFDVLLIDCVMPEMDGYALASAVRATGSAARSSSSATVLGGPALLAMTPRHDPEEVKKCLEAGFDALLIKPFTMTSLDQKIREHVLQ